MMLSMVLATTLLCSLAFCTAIPIPFTPPPGAPPAQNAADAWNQFFLETEHVEYPYDYDFEWTDEAQTLYEELSPVFQQARAVSTIEYCDWVLDYSKGLDLLVPHMSKLRGAQALLQFSMYGDIQNGNISSAVEHMDSMLGITKHQNTTSLTIGSLVASSSFSMATQQEELIDATQDLVQLDSMLEKVDSFDSFDPFGIRRSVGEERKSTLNWLQGTQDPDLSIMTSVLNQAEIDTSGWDMKQEIENYSNTMKKMEAIFQMPNQEEAQKAAVALEQEAKELGNLTALLTFPAGRLLDTAFNASENVAEFKALLEQRIDMLRNPNSATYFLKAVETYNEIDTKDRMNAMQHGDFEILEEPFRLFATACSLPPKQITLANSAGTPHWIAPLYSLALDCIARGTSTDRLVIMEFVGHMSQQDRFAASILAAKLFDYDWGPTPEPEEPHLKVAYEKAKKQIPTADEFMLHGSADSERERLIEQYEIEEKWNPNPTNTLVMTLTLAKLRGIDQQNPEAWKVFIRAIGLPDTHPAFLFAEEEYNPELIQFLKLPQEESFDEMLHGYSSLIGRARYKEATSRER